MREITGGSAMIRDVWEILFRAAEEEGIPAVRASAGDEFSYEHVFDTWDMAELFCGGGNETILFRDETVFRRLNRRFTFLLQTECPGMIPLCVCAEATGDYREDYRRLMRKVQEKKNAMPSGRNFAMMPFSGMNRVTFQPITRLVRRGTEYEEMTEESWSKDRKAQHDPRINDQNRFLDDLVLDRDNRSLLAVVHADGNNMGQKIIQYLQDETGYDECVPKMRKFTREIARIFTGETENDPLWKMKEAARENGWPLRIIVNDGDDLTYVCTAEAALELTDVYLRAVLEQGSSDLRSADGTEFRFSSCAGICVFHSHYPFAMAYSLAESACSSAKESVHRTRKEEAWIDFHYQRSGLNEKLEDIRERHGTGGLMARPWRCAERPIEGQYTIPALREMAEKFRKEDVSRTRIKTLCLVCEDSLPEARNEMQLLYYRHPDVWPLLERLWGKDPVNQLKALYDFSEIYDLWFRKEADGNGEDSHHAAQ